MAPWGTQSLPQMTSIADRSNLATSARRIHVSVFSFAEITMCLVSSDVKFRFGEMCKSDLCVGVLPERLLGADWLAQFPLAG